jgi:K+ transporter
MSLRSGKQVTDSKNVKEKVIVLLIREIPEVKQHIRQAVDARDKQLRDIALKIHAHPELGFQERQAVQWLTEPLKDAGFEVEIGVAGLETGRPLR